jgi:hypothetical protein
MAAEVVKAGLLPFAAIAGNAFLVVVFFVVTKQIDSLSLWQSWPPWHTDAPRRLRVGECSKAKQMRHKNFQRIFRYRAIKLPRASNKRRASNTNAGLCRTSSRTLAGTVENERIKPSV